MSKIERYKYLPFATVIQTVFGKGVQIIVNGIKVWAVVPENYPLPPGYHYFDKRFWKFKHIIEQFSICSIYSTDGKFVIDGVRYLGRHASIPNILPEGAIYIEIL